MIELLTERLEFREPWLLLAAAVAVPVWLLAASSSGRVVFSSLRILPSAGHSWRTRLAWVPDLLVALAAVALAVALAGPRIANKTTQIEREGIAIMMVVDTSGSMRALDLSVGDEERTRLDAVLAVFEEFVLGTGDLAGRPDDVIGLVSFARFADTRCPLTLDHGSLVTIARDLEIVKQASENSTAIGDGLGLAVLRLRDARHDVESKVVILLTDGVNETGEQMPLAAAELAKKEGIKVYTIGAGTTGIARVRVPSVFGGGTVLRAQRVVIDEDTLRQIAERTGGEYFRATDADGLREVYKQIDRLERTKISEERFRDYREYFRLAVAIALALAAVAWLLRATVLRRLP